MQSVRFIKLMCLFLALILGSLGISQISTLQFDLRFKPESRIQEVFERKLPKAYKSQAHSLAKHVIDLANTHQFEPAMILSFIEVESQFNPRAESNRGALGLMQIKPSTAKYMAKKMGLTWTHKNQLFEPEFNLRLGVAYLYYLKHKHFRNDSSWLAIVAYNYGPSLTKVIRARYQNQGQEMPTVPYMLKIQTHWKAMKLATL